MSARDVETSDGVRLALYRRRPYAGGRPAVLLVHGAFNSHTAYLRTYAGLWNVNGRWVGRDGFDYFAAMARIRVPLLSVAGAADRFFAPAAACRQVVEQWGDPRKRFALAGPGGRLNHRGCWIGAPLMRAGRSSSTGCTRPSSR